MGGIRGGIRSSIFPQVKRYSSGLMKAENASAMMMMIVKGMCLILFLSKHLSYFMISQSRVQTLNCICSMLRCITVQSDT